MQQFLFYLLCFGFFCPLNFLMKGKKSNFFLFGKELWQGIYFFRNGLNFLTDKQLLIDLIHIEILRSK